MRSWTLPQKLRWSCDVIKNEMREFCSKLLSGQAGIGTVLLCLIFFFLLKILNVLIDVFTQIEEAVLAFSIASKNRICSPEGTQRWHRWLPWCICLMNFLLIPPRELHPAAWRKHKIKNERSPTPALSPIQLLFIATEHPNASPACSAGWNHSSDRCGTNNKISSGVWTMLQRNTKLFCLN